MGNTSSRKGSEQQGGASTGGETTGGKEGADQPKTAPSPAGMTSLGAAAVGMNQMAGINANKDCACRAVFDK